MAQDVYGNYIPDLTLSTVYTDPTDAGGGSGGGGGGSLPAGAGFVIRGHGAPTVAPSVMNADYDDALTWLYADEDDNMRGYTWNGSVWG